MMGHNIGFTELQIIFTVVSVFTKENAGLRSAIGRAPDS